MTTTRSQFDSADLGEMLLIADASYHSGFKQVTVDTQDQIAILCELIELRGKCKATELATRS